MPEIAFDSLDAIPEGLREDAKQNDGGKFVVNVVSNKKLSEFRDNNVNLARERDALKDRVTKLAPIVGEDWDQFVTEVTELRTIAQQVKDGKLKGNEAVNAEVERRVKESLDQRKAEVEQKDSKIRELSTASAEWKQKYERSVLHQQIANAIHGQDSVVNPLALPDILMRAEAVFHVQPDGKVIPKDGESILYGSDGVTPMSPKEWLVKLVSDAPYLGKQSVGGGAAGGNTGSGVGKKFGMSEAEFQKLPATERIRLARQAGV